MAKTMTKRGSRAPDKVEHLCDVYRLYNTRRLRAIEAVWWPPFLDDADFAALDDILRVQHFGDVRAAAATVHELFTAASGTLPGDTLAERWAAYCAWNLSGRPKRWKAPTPRVRREVRAALKCNAMAAGRPS